MSEYGGVGKWGNGDIVERLGAYSAWGGVGCGAVLGEDGGREGEGDDDVLHRGFRGNRVSGFESGKEESTNSKKKKADLTLWDFYLARFPKCGSEKGWREEKKQAKAKLRHVRQAR